MQHTLSTPCARQDLAALRAGDTVLLSGTVYTARDAAHKRMMELLDAGGEPPFPLAGSAVYYVGPTPGRPGQVVGSAGPTTSGRMDAYSPRLIRLGQLVMIGKGARSEAVKRAVKECGAVYLAALGGAGALLVAHGPGGLHIPHRNAREQGGHEPQDQQHHKPLDAAGILLLVELAVEIQLDAALRRFLPLQKAAPPMWNGNNLL